MITISIVSHGQRMLAVDLLADLAGCPQVSNIILTHNIPEAEVVIPREFAGRLTTRCNTNPMGFGANHNAAFRHCQTPFFCVLNPDVRLGENPFPQLLGCFANENVALCAPAVLNPAGEREDSARHFPRPLGLMAKLLGFGDGKYLLSGDADPVSPDWVAGMFMLFRTVDFAVMEGFDEDFFLYYEDVDLCARLWKADRQILVCPQAVVFHAARRESHRNYRYMKWHLASMARYFLKHLGRLPNNKQGTLPALRGIRKI